MSSRVTKDSPPKKDLTGLRSGKLVVESFAGRRQLGKNKRWYCYWNCRCDCRNVATIVAHSLTKRGRTRSCGCIPAGSPANPHRRDHPYEYGKWLYLIKVHGADVCDRWKDFDLFFADMGKCPHQSRLRRKKGNSYDSENCFWFRREHHGGCYSKLLTFNGETLSRTMWSKRTGIKAAVISERLSKGWSVGDALTIPSGKRSSQAIKLNSSGIERLRIARAGGASIKKLAKRFRLSPSSVRRISSGELFAYMDGPVCEKDAKAE